MKRNFILVFVLFMLCLFTYVVEERWGGLERERQRREAQLIDPSKTKNLLAFKTKKASLIFTEDGIFVEKNRIRASETKVQSLFDELYPLQIERRIDGLEIERLGQHHFFDDFSDRLRFEFEEVNIDFILGRKLEFDETFYMKVVSGEETNYLVVRDTSVKSDIYFREDKRRAMVSYLKLKNIMERDDVFFYDTHIFKKDFIQSLGGGEKIFRSVHFDGQSYSALWDNFKTVPESFKGISYDHDEFNRFYHHLLGLEAKELIEKYRQRSLGQKEASLTLMNSRGGTTVLSLYKSYGKLKGLFLTTNFDSHLYEMNPKDVGIFRQSIQDFWNLSLGEDVLNRPFTLIYGKERIGSTERRGEDFSFLRRIFSTRAKRVSKIKTKRKHLSDPPLVFSGENPSHRFRMEENDEKTVVIDENNEVEYLYDENFAISKSIVEYFLRQ